MVRLIMIKCLKITSNLLQAITLSKPMNNFMCKPSKEREQLWCLPILKRDERN
jgi:hypothetical protein